LATLASPGYFVASPGQSQQQPAPAGSYAPGPGNTAATLASPGHFVASAGQASQTPAPAGSYASGPGNTMATLASPGFFVSLPGQDMPTPAPPGSYAPGMGNVLATPASPGYFVASVGEASEEPAPPGTYVPNSGASASDACPGGVGGSFSYGGASACRAGTFTGAGTVSPAFSSNPAQGGNLDFGTISSNATKTLTINITNDVTDPGNLADLTDLTLLDISFGGPDAGVFAVPGFVVGTVVHANDSWLLNVSFMPLVDGSFDGSLRIDTDQFASVGAPGQTFTYTLEGNAIPEPAGLAVCLLAPLWLRPRGGGWRRPR